MRECVLAWECVHLCILARACVRVRVRIPRYIRPAVNMLIINIYTYTEYILSIYISIYPVPWSQSLPTVFYFLIVCLFTFLVVYVVIISKNGGEFLFHARYMSFLRKDNP